MVIKVKYHHGMEAYPLAMDETNRAGDWVDLYLADDVCMSNGSFKILPLGVSMELPKGYEAIVAPRSSTFKKYGILMANGIGIIDENFCGDNDEWGFPAVGTRDVFLKKGTRICQFRILEHQPILEFEQREHLKGRDRGGFGSTGD